MGWYNGWSPEERRATLPIQRAAIRAGLIPKPRRCSVCGFVAGTAGSTNRVMLHDERYDYPLEAYPICRHCHWALHARFDQPARWLRLIRRHGNGRRWFEALSLDPATQWRPFAASYPRGLLPV